MSGPKHLEIRLAALSENLFYLRESPTSAKRADEGWKDSDVLSPLWTATTDLSWEEGLVSHNKAEEDLETTTVMALLEQ
jgi:hypothetical protein